MRNKCTPYIVTRSLPRPSLSTLDFTQLRPLTWETSPKTAGINMRLPEALLTALKTKAAQRGIPYQRLIRELLESGV